MGKRFNPAPGWPAPPEPGWLPPDGWAPDPAWPPAPKGWRVVVDDDVPATRREKRAERTGRRGLGSGAPMSLASDQAPVGLLDFYGGYVGRTREAQRDYTAMQLQQAQLQATHVLVAEQRETNRLLRALAGEQDPQQPSYGVSA